MHLEKLQFRFTKSEALRYLSHRDLLRAFERALAEAGLDARRPVFPHALETGAASLDEAA